MRLLRSYRTRLQIAFLLLGLAAMGLTGWQASSRAADALRSATFDHLNAVRETRALQIERFFHEAGQHLAALASDAITHTALAAFRSGYAALPEAADADPRRAALAAYYEALLRPRVALEGNRAEPALWSPRDGRTVTVQSRYIVENPHPPRAKDLLLTVPAADAYDDAHASYHPTFHRYAGAFGFYDLFLVDATTGRVLYTVFKEIDLGATLIDEPYRHTGLARAYARAMRASVADPPVFEDYTSYAPSGFAPAAFLAVPVWHGGVKVGVIVVQVAIDEVNRVMTAQGRWREEGLGETGHAYVVGRDGSLRSDVRFELEHADEAFAALAREGVAAVDLAKIRGYGTAILHLALPADHLVTGLRDDPLHLETVDFRDVPVLRTTSPLNIPGFDWRIVAEIDAREALAPAVALRNRMLAIGLGLTVVLFLAARVLATSATRPLLSLAEGAARLGGREFGTRVVVEREDELGQLAAAFNRMAESLEKSTVSREELEVLAGKLITAQEEERKRIARDLHDDFSQRLAALAIEAGSIARVVDEPDRSADLGALSARVEHLRRGVARLGDDIHDVSRRLHPATLADLGLVAAVESECRGFFERGGAPVEMDVDGDVDGLPPPIALALYRVVQEALRNVEKHADAAEVRVRLARAAGTIELVVADDGRGFAPATPGRARGLGLASMGERVRLLGGQLQIDAAPGRGTRITVRVPASFAGQELHEQAPRVAR
jgi:signal transduction histidine kinase